MAALVTLSESPSPPLGDGKSLGAYYMPDMNDPVRCAASQPMQKTFLRTLPRNVFVLSWKYDLHHTRRSGSPPTHAHLVSSAGALALRGIMTVWHQSPPWGRRVGIVAHSWYSLLLSQRHWLRVSRVSRDLLVSSSPRYEHFCSAFI